MTRLKSKILMAPAFLVICAVAPVEAAEQLVPANFNARNDSQGYRWDIQSNGYVQNGTNSCFGSACVLMVNGSGVGMSQKMMTSDGSEFVLSGQYGNIYVVRRVKVMTKTAVVRYIDQFTNRTASPMVVRVRLQTSLGRNQSIGVSTDSGRMIAAGTNTALTKKELGTIVHGHPTSGQLGVLFYLPGASGKVQPTFFNQNNVQFFADYNLTIPAGKTVSLAHGLAQRRFATVPQGRGIAALFKPFRSSSWLRGLPSDARKSIVNLRRHGFGWSDGGAFASLEALDIVPGSSDVLAVDEQTRLRGTANCNQISVHSRFGLVKMPLDKVAAIVGKRNDAPPRVFLRDGQVLFGDVELDDLKFTMSTGLSLGLSIDRLDRLVLNAQTSDGRPASKAMALLETLDGDRVAIQPTEAALTCTTPWGPRRIPVDQIQRWSPSTEIVGHRFELRDGSRLFAYVDNPVIQLDTVDFGRREFYPSQMRNFRAVAAVRSNSPDALDAVDPYLLVPHVILAGENLLVGQIDLPALNFVTSGEIIPVPPNQIREMRRLDNPEDSFGGEQVLFEALLWDGGEIAGSISEIEVPIRSDDLVLTVKTRDLAEVNVPVPTVPDALRERIGKLIRELGGAEFQQREQASNALAELGYLARPQLDEASRQTNDPEVRRRVERLLDDLQDDRKDSSGSFRY